MREGARVSQGRITARRSHQNCDDSHPLAPLAGTMSGRDDRMRSGVEVQLPLVHLAPLQLHRDVLNPEEEHRIMNVL